MSVVLRTADEEATMPVNPRLTLCALLFALVACGGGSGGSEQPPQAGANTPETPPTTPTPPPPTTPDPPTPPTPADPPPPPPPDPDPETPPTAPIACTKADTTMSPGTAAVAQCANTQYDVLTDLPYATGGSHLIDLYKPRAATAALPLVVWIHGGSWRYLDKSHMDAPRSLICNGFAVASIDYRLSNEAPFPAQIRDVKAAIRHLRANATSYGLDPNRIAVFGSSAGGHLGALAGTSGGVADLESLSMGNASTSSRVQAVIDWFGHSDLTQLDAQLLAQGCPAESANRSQPNSLESQFLGCTLGDPSCSAQAQRANPIAYVGADDPPHLIMHGTQDCTVPRAQATGLFEALKAQGTCVSMITVTGAGHSGDAWLTDTVQDVLVRYLNETLKK
jgi:acetyl esterase/lipase